MQQFLDFVIRHWYLVAAFTVVMILILIEEAKSQGISGKVATPAMTTSLINKNEAVVVDIREATVFQEGHIIHALNIPAKELEAHLSKLEKYKNKNIIIACQRGQTATAFANRLRKKGFEHVLVLKQGMPGWKTDGMPLVKGK